MIKIHGIHGIHTWYTHMKLPQNKKQSPQRNIADALSQTSVCTEFPSLQCGHLTSCICLVSYKAL